MVFKPGLMIAALFAALLVFKAPLALSQGFDLSQAEEIAPGFFRSGMFVIKTNDGGKIDGIFVATPQPITATASVHKIPSKSNGEIAQAEAYFKASSADLPAMLSSMGFNHASSNSSSMKVFFGSPKNLGPTIAVWREGESTATLYQRWGRLVSEVMAVGYHIQSINGGEIRFRAPDKVADKVIIFEPRGETGIALKQRYALKVDLSEFPDIVEPIQMLADIDIRPETLKTIQSRMDSGNHKYIPTLPTENGKTISLAMAQKRGLEFEARLKESHGINNLDAAMLLNDFFNIASKVPFGTRVTYLGQEFAISYGPNLLSTKSYPWDFSETSERVERHAYLQIMRISPAGEITTFDISKPSLLGFANFGILPEDFNGENFMRVFDKEFVTRRKKFAEQFGTRNELCKRTFRNFMRENEPQNW